MHMAEFKEEPKGTVVSMAVGEREGNSFNIWFPYTKSYMNTVKEGSLVAVRNFASTSSTKCFSILELTSVFPVHYALGNSPSDTEKAFPGFVIEAAKSAKVDWEQETPIEQTTKIRAESISTGIQLNFEGQGKPKLERDFNLPMVGEEAHLLTDELTDDVINRGLKEPGVSTISSCRMVLNPEIKVLIATDELLRTHFSVFGFTGAGKSNLMSALVSDLLTSQSSIKVLFFDLMSEYTVLLVDLLDSIPDAMVLALDENSVPGGDATLDYLRGDSNKLEAATSSIVRTLLLPRELMPLKEAFSAAVRRLLQANKIRVYDPFSPTFNSSEVRTQLLHLVTGRIGNTEAGIRAWIENHAPDDGSPIQAAELALMVGEADDYLQNGIPLLGQRTPLPATGRTVVSSIRTAVETLTSPLDFPATSKLQFPELNKLLNSEEKPSLIIVQSNSDDSLRLSSAEFVNRIFDSRRRQGRIAPQVLFAFDEADEFMPQQAQDTYALSKAAITRIARRGRKFGIGIGFATQRVAYLDTSILAQPHTYFISKLPRAYDREVVSNAFGIPQDMLSRTLKFTKGQWLLVSYDATGLENVPVPVQFPNSNARIRLYLGRLAAGR
jgi:uncharacterized protein DUF87